VRTPPLAGSSRLAGRARRAAPLLLALFASCSSTDDEAPEEARPPEPAPSRPAIELASPFVGPGGFAFCCGSAFVGAMSPFGMAKPGPDTVGAWGDVNFLHYSGYWFEDDAIEGFSHLHLHGTGATDYGVLAFQPSDGVTAARTVRKGRGAKFRKETERASPGYYAVTLDDTQTRVEMTATPHAAHHRYTFGGGVASPTVIVDLTHRLSSGRVASASATLDDDGLRFRGQLRSIGGMSGGFGGYEVYFEGRASRPWSTRRALAASEPAEGASVDWVEAMGVKPNDPQVPAGFALSFEPGGPPVEIAVGLSLVSAEGAKANLNAEISEGATFDVIRTKAEDAW
jgi:putative alpha-1,2-mannosidase